MAPRAIVLFDGVCNLCNGAVQFILDRDPGERFHFASLQSDRARTLLGEHGRTPPAGDPETIYLIEDGRLFERSTAALRIARHLSFPWWLAAAGLIVPRPLRDLVYRFVAKNRYRFFGRTDECRVPTPALRARMLG